MTVKGTAKGVGTSLFSAAGVANGAAAVGDAGNGQDEIIKQRIDEIRRSSEELRNRLRSAVRDQQPVKKD